MFGLIQFEMQKKIVLTFSANSGETDADAISDRALNNRLLPIDSPTTTQSIGSQRVYNPTTFALTKNGSNYSPILSESSSYSDHDLQGHSQRHPHPQADELGLPNNGPRTRWEPSQQRQLLQAHAQSFVNSQGKTETEIF